MISKAPSSHGIREMLRLRAAGVPMDLIGPNGLQPPSVKDIPPIPDPQPGAEMDFDPLQPMAPLWNPQQPQQPKQPQQPQQPQQVIPPDQPPAQPPMRSVLKRGLLG